MKSNIIRKGSEGDRQKKIVILGRYIKNWLYISLALLLPVLFKSSDIFL
jgi:hypothetical protein